MLSPWMLSKPPNGHARNAARAAAKMTQCIRSAALIGRAGWCSSSVLGQSEHALADDVALDFAGAARDRVLTGADDAVEPARRVGHARARLVHEHARPEQLAGEISDLDTELGAEQLQDGSLGPGRL